MQLNARIPPNAKKDADTMKDALLAQFRTLTPAQIDTFVDNQVTTLADARRLFKIILKLELLIMRRLGL